MRLLVAGSRYIPYHQKYIDYILECIDYFKADTIVSGCAVGIDTFGIYVAKQRKMDLIELPVTKEEWNQFGKAAGIIRNKKLDDSCDCGCIIWDGVSSGTRNMIDRLTKSSKPFILYTNDKKQMFSSTNLEGFFDE